LTIPAEEIRAVLVNSRRANGGLSYVVRFTLRPPGVRRLAEFTVERVGQYVEVEFESVNLGLPRIRRSPGSRGGDGLGRPWGLARHLLLRLESRMRLSVARASGSEASSTPQSAVREACREHRGAGAAARIAAPAHLGACIKVGACTKAKDDKEPIADRLFDSASDERASEQKFLPAKRLCKRELHGVMRC
jgi:hypothetical protein